MRSNVQTPVTYDSHASFSVKSGYFWKELSLFDEAIWYSVKYLFATFCAEVVRLALILTLPLSRLLVYIHATDRIPSHYLTPFF